MSSEQTKRLKAEPANVSAANGSWLGLVGCEVLAAALEYG